MEKTNKPYATKHLTLLLLAIIIGLGVFLRLYQIGKQSFWIDEVATMLDIQGDLKTFYENLNNFANMRLYHIFAYTWMKIFPNATDGTLRALSALFSTATIPIVFLIGHNLTTDKAKGDAIGLVAGFLIAINAFEIQYAQEFRSYTLTVLLTTLSTLLLMRFIESEHPKVKWLIWYVLVTTASVYSHMYAIFIIAAHGISLTTLLFDKRKYQKQLLQIIICYVVISALLIPLALSAFEKGAILTWIPEPTLKTLKNFFVAISGYKGSTLIVMFFLFCLLGLWAGTQTHNGKELITKWKYLLIASGLVIPVMSAFLFSKIFSPIFIPRYLLYVIPYLTLLSASGIIALANIKTCRRTLLLTGLIASIVAIVIISLLAGKGLRRYYTDFKKQDWRQTAQLLKEKCSDSLLVYYHGTGQRGALYYDPSLVSQKTTWSERLVYNPASFANSAPPFPDQYRQVCLVLSLINTEERAKQAELIIDVIVQRLPNVSVYEFSDVKVHIFAP